jgi:hypothetical protein
MEPRARNSLIFFLILTFALSSIFYIRSFSGAPLGQVPPLLMWMPGVAAVVTQLLFYRTIKGLCWRSGSWRYLALAVLILPHLILPLKRVYAESTGVILLKSASVLFLAVVLNNLASFLAIRMTLALV